jgi:hypothetical protein
LVNASGVGTYIFFGENPMPAACVDDTDPTTCGKHLAGDASFTIAANSPTDSVLAGTLAGGDLTTDSGTISIELPLGETTPLQIDLVGAQLLSTVSATGLAGGRIGGAITSDDVDNKLIPTVHSLITDIVEEDCPNAVADNCMCVEGSAGKSVLAFFDGDGDCKIPLADLMNNSIIGATLRNPDLDLFDENGAYNPNKDEINDSLSLTIEFVATGATFPLPSGI